MIIISFFIQSQSLFTIFLDPVIQVVKIGIFKIVRHKLCNCLPNLLMKKYFFLSYNMSKNLFSWSLQILFTFKVCNFIVDTMYMLRFFFFFFFCIFSFYNLKFLVNIYLIKIIRILMRMVLYYHTLYMLRFFFFCFHSS